MSLPEEGQVADVQFKMCKKIAQLTKVIYQLNCRNEDAETNLKLLSEQYEGEIGAIMVDAKAKLETLRNQLDSKREEQKVQSVIKELTRQHQQEKNDAMRLFEQFRTESHNAEVSSKKSIDDRIAAMTVELNRIQRAIRCHSPPNEGCDEGIRRAAFQGT